jgi:hypothetical protein
MVSVILSLTDTGHVQVAEAEIDPKALDKIREARVRP